MSLLLSLALFACSTGTEAEKAEVLDAVKYYNSMMRRAYLEANIDLMQGVATSNQMKYIMPTILALRAELSFMMAIQETFIVQKVKAGKDRASVKTEERWRYWWQHKDTGRITKPEEELTYSLRYHLVRENGTWKVDSIETAD